MIIICWLKEFYYAMTKTIPLSGHEWVGERPDYSKKTHTIECEVCGKKSIGIL